MYSIQSVLIAWTHPASSWTATTALLRHKTINQNWNCDNRPQTKDHHKYPHGIVGLHMVLHTADTNADKTHPISVHGKALNDVWSSNGWPLNVMIYGNRLTCQPRASEKWWWTRQWFPPLCAAEWAMTNAYVHTQQPTDYSSRTNNKFATEIKNSEKQRSYLWPWTNALGWWHHPKASIPNSFVLALLWHYFDL